MKHSPLRFVLKVFQACGTSPNIFCDLEVSVVISHLQISMDMSHMCTVHVVMCVRMFTGIADT